MRRSSCYWAPSLCLFGAMLALWAPSARAQDAARKVVKKVDAQYPAALKHRGIGGTVRLKVYIKADGTVRDTEVLGGSPALAESAQKAVLQWRFTQGSAETTMEVAVVFNPDA
jgi:TonB family protein